MNWQNFITVNHQRALCAGAAMLAVSAAAVFAEPAGPTFSRAPLKAKPYAELPLGSVKAEGWLSEELQRMASGMAGHLDEWYPEVCGERNAWLGGDGDTWERGPYWIDGLYPLARLLDDKALQAKAQKWIDWTLTHQHDDGYIGPVELKKKDRTRPAPEGAQVEKPEDWWPRMVMLKILQQHYMATGDARVVSVLHKYFRYQLKMLPEAPLFDPKNKRSGSWWAAQRGGDNLMVVLWFYNVTGEKYLLELADLIYKQTIPVTEWFESGEVVKLRGDQFLTGDRRSELKDFHCVNLAQAMKTPLIRFQQDGDARHLAATRKGFDDIRAYHGLPHGMYGGDEHMHGRALDRGSELCSAVEMMFSLEKMMEISGEAEFGDRLEQIAFNILPTQCTDDQYARQYFSQANQVQVTFGERDFFNDGGDRQVYGLLCGYPCCTCNLHQGWPKFAQHLWMASADGGLAALAYAPSRVTTKVGDAEVTVCEETVYPFEETVRFKIQTSGASEFPLHLRIPGWCQNAKVRVNGEAQAAPASGGTAVIKRTWKNGDVVELSLPMTLRKSNWEDRSVAIERGPLLYALRVEENWTEVKAQSPEGVPANAMHRGYRECRPVSAWNYALLESKLKKLEAEFEVVQHPEALKGYLWNLAGAPVEIRAQGIRMPQWGMYANSAGRVPLSPAQMPAESKLETIRLIPYGCTTLRIAAFPWIRDAKGFIRK